MSYIIEFEAGIRMQRQITCLKSTCSDVLLPNITLFLIQTNNFMKAIKRMKEIQKIQRLFHQNNSDPARTRTWNLLIRSQMPYLLGHGAFLETDECQSIEPYWRKRQFSCRCRGGLIAPLCHSEDVVHQKLLTCRLLGKTLEEINENW